MCARWNRNKIAAPTRLNTPTPKMAGKGAGLSGLKAAAMRSTPITATRAEPASCQVSVPKDSTRSGGTSER